MFGLHTIQSTKANLAVRRKRPFLSQEDQPINARAIERYQFPQVSEEEQKAVRERIREEMKWERRCYWMIEISILLALAALLF